jgi:hypothetical protein
MRKDTWMQLPRAKCNSINVSLLVHSVVERVVSLHGRQKKFAIVDFQCQQSSRLDKIQSRVCRQCMQDDNESQSVSNKPIININKNIVNTATLDWPSEYHTYRRSSTQPQRNTLTSAAEQRPAHQCITARNSRKSNTKLSYRTYKKGIILLNIFAKCPIRRNSSFSSSQQDAVLGGRLTRYYGRANECSRHQNWFSSTRGHVYILTGLIETISKTAEIITNFQSFYCALIISSSVAWQIPVYETNCAKTVRCGATVKTGARKLECRLPTFERRSSGKNRENLELQTTLKTQFVSFEGHPPIWSQFHLLTTRNSKRCTSRKCSRRDVFRGGVTGALMLKLMCQRYRNRIVTNVGSAEWTWRPAAFPHCGRRKNRQLPLETAPSEFQIDRESGSNSSTGSDKYEASLRLYGCA